MTRRSLKPQLNQIRAWVRQGRTDAWIAHQLEVSASELREFRRQHDLTPDGDEAGSSEIDLRDEIEAEIEAAAARDAEAEASRAEAEASRTESEPTGDSEGEGDEDADSTESGESSDDDGEGRPRPRRRRRGRRGGRGRRKEIEATFDHGENDGYGLWLDPSVKENSVYVENWAGHREVTVRVDVDQIVIRRAGGESESESDDGNGNSDSD